jgi:hypothetical protein
VSSASNAHDERIHVVRASGGPVSGADVVWPSVAELVAQEQELRWKHSG